MCVRCEGVWCVCGDNKQLQYYYDLPCASFTSTAIVNIRAKQQTTINNQKCKQNPTNMQTNTKSEQKQ